MAANDPSHNTLDAMLISEPLAFIKAFIDSLNQALKTEQPNRDLSRIQCGWLGFV